MDQAGHLIALLIFILSLSVESLEMCAESTVALGPLARGMKVEDLSLHPDMCLQDIKYVMNPVLPLCHFLGGLARHGLGEFFVASPSGFEPRFAHFH